MSFSALSVAHTMKIVAEWGADELKTVPDIRKLGKTVDKIADIAYRVSCEKRII